MKKIFVTIFVLLMLLSFCFSNVVEARTIRVRGYYKRNTGSYVMPHYRTSPNRTKWDNWSTKGNINPFTGKKGTVDPWKSSKYLRF
ncbi:MAG: hypothetical protein ACPLW7_03940 [Minisyncoccia bacterium]